MKLSELKTGERAIIIRVTGHGGFRKRIVEMGFVKGEQVEMLLDIGCIYAQGFLYSRPIPIEEFMEKYNTPIEENTPEEQAG